MILTHVKRQTPNKARPRGRLFLGAKMRFNRQMIMVVRHQLVHQQK